MLDLLEKAWEKIVILDSNKNDQEINSFLGEGRKKFYIRIARANFYRLQNKRPWYMRDDNPDKHLDDALKWLKNEYALLDSKWEKKDKEMIKEVEQAKNTRNAKILFSWVMSAYVTIFDLTVDKLDKYTEDMKESIQGSGKDYSLLDREGKKSSDEMKEIYQNKLKQYRLEIQARNN